MKTYVDCIPCFYRQIIEASRLAGLEDSTIKEIIDETGKILEESKLDSTPPEVVGNIYEILRKRLGNIDFYKQIKEKSNNLALSVYDLIKEKVSSSEDSLLTAIEMAIAGNIIDFGVKNSINVEKEVEKILKKENQFLKNNNNNFFAYEEFNSLLEKSKKIVYLADNSGEILFDRVLIEEIKRLFPKINIIFAVKETPVINDALKEDALFCKLDKYSTVVSSGSKIPGTMLDLCSKDFLELYKDSDIVISKGQGNFESFTDKNKPVFYLFMAKCQQVAKEVGCEIGSINLFFNGSK
ncbi:MAG TPA: ARMT1-like domain-containing protein [Spirochaetota bacterium]|nr:ARMT1-like domain-containing protein [Spirochaetota bacterium]